MYVTASTAACSPWMQDRQKALEIRQHRLPEGIMPCCDVVNRGAALCDNLVIFATLDAQLVALNKDTGKVVWKDKIDDYAAGYSPAAPPHRQGKLSSPACPVASSASEGRIDATMPRPARWCGRVRPSEGHMGYKWVNGKGRERHLQHLNATWTGDLWKTGGAGHLERRHLRSKPTWSSRHRQPGSVEQPPAPRRQPVLVATVAIDAGYRQDRLAPCQTTPTTAGTSTAWNRFVSFDYKDRRPARSSGRRQGRP